MFFPERLFLNEDFNIVRPETLGNKKLPADLDKLASFLRKECKDADGLILSVDTLLYGGLIPPGFIMRRKKHCFPAWN